MAAPLTLNEIAQAYVDRLRIWSDRAREAQAADQRLADSKHDVEVSKKALSERVGKNVRVLNLLVDKGTALVRVEWRLTDDGSYTEVTHEKIQ